MNPEATLNQIEGVGWADPPLHPLIDKRVRRLGTIPMRELTGEDYDLLIRNRRALRTAVPLAIELIEQDLFAEGIFQGDVLGALISLDSDFWGANPTLQARLNRLVPLALQRIGELDDVQQQILEPRLRSYREHM
jgi:broad specificity phosphatase PhoE